MSRSHPELRLELARPADAAAMAAIYNESLSGAGVLPQMRHADGAGLQRLIDAHRHGGWPMWVVRHPHGLAGWAALRPTPWWPEVTHRAADFSVFVARAWQGSGAAALPVLAVPEAGLAQGFETVLCTIMGSNRKSIALARACGLTCWGRLPRFACWGDHVEDVELWGCQLEDPLFRQRLERLAGRLEGRRRLAV